MASFDHRCPIAVSILAPLIGMMRGRFSVDAPADASTTAGSVKPVVV